MLMLVNLSLYAQLHYVARGTLVGKMIDVKVNASANNKRYSIRIDMQTMGMIKLMTGGQIEHHSSYGSVRNGEYYAKEYKIDKTYKKIHYIRRYLFDYRNKKITKISMKWKEGKKLYETKEILKYFTHNDILTLYHNVLRFKKSHKPGSYSLTLAGAEKEGGKLKFVLPGSTALTKEQSKLGMKQAEVIKVFMYRSFLSGGKGSLTFGIDKNGIAEKIILDSVKMLGKVTLKRIR